MAKRITCQLTHSLDLQSRRKLVNNARSGVKLCQCISALLCEIIHLSAILAIGGRYALLGHFAVDVNTALSANADQANKSSH